MNFASSLAYPLPSQDIEIDSRELDRASREPNRPTYTFDTLSEMRPEFAHLAFVIGTDQLENFDRWHRFPDVLSLSHWIVLLRRPLDRQEQVQAALQRFASSGLIRRLDDLSWQTRGGTLIQLVPTQAPAISSTTIREQISKTGIPPEGTLLPEVHTYLKLHRIYGTR